MEQDFVGALLGSRRKDGKGSRASSEDDAMVIDCRGCEVTPMPGSGECTGCMVREMCSLGGHGRVIMRTGRDTEVSGPACRAIREASSLRRWSMPQSPPKGKCSRCDASRFRVMERAWATFPEDGIGFARAMLDGGGNRGDECGRCIESTRRALDLLERRLDQIVGWMVDQ
ncbi:MAG: hypothetical protein ACI38Y_00525 [Candidatus Methanomethylophilaceae archaeon]